MTESKLQSECHLWAWNTYPHLRRKFFAIPNSAKRTAIEGSQMKATGTVKGTADYILTNDGDYLFIEFKTDTGKQSPEQKKFQEVHSSRYVIIRTKEDFICRFQKFYFGLQNGKD